MILPLPIVVVFDACEFREQIPFLENLKLEFAFTNSLGRVGAKSCDLVNILPFLCIIIIVDVL
jgi:hypothetical protein